MKVKTFEFKKTISHDFNNITIGIQVELGDGDSELEALERADKFVTRSIRRRITQQYEIENAQHTVDNLGAHPKSREQSQELLDLMDGDDLRF